MRKVQRIFLISIFIVFLLVVNVFAYENEIYKIDVPDSFESVSYNESVVFVKKGATSDSSEGIAIFAYPSSGLKKDITTMSNSDVDELLSYIVKDDQETQVMEKKKEKLGKSKALKARVKLNEDNETTYMDVYITVSDKHIVLVSFMANSEVTLDNSEYNSIKKSFKMKEKTTNVTFIKAGIVILILGVVAFKAKKRFVG